MKLVVQAQVLPDKSESLLTLMRQFNVACDWLSGIAFQEKLFGWLHLQRRAYHEIKLRFGLTGSAARMVTRKVAYAYRNKARRQALACFKPLGSIPLYQHSYRRDGTVRFYGQQHPFVCKPGVILSSKHQATLSYDGATGKFYIHQTIEIQAPEPYAQGGYLGCDLGIRNILADSDGALHIGKRLNNLRRRQARLRAKLQSKAKHSRSALRLLNKRRRREARFGRWVNHNISKRVVAKAQGTRRAIALEDLRGIRSRITVRKGQRRLQHSWAFGQLRAFIEYKAAVAGVPVKLVDPRYTSQTCSVCGTIDRRNRTGESFECVGCHASGHADTNAARVIAGRASGDRPYAPPSKEMREPLEGLRVIQG